jgi:hypothetical protein
MHFVKSNLINIEDDGSKKHLALDGHCTGETKKIPCYKTNKGTWKGCDQNTTLR